MTVGQNVALPLEMQTEQDPETIDIIVSMKLDWVGLLHRKDNLPSEISGGQQKRAGLARAIALDPRVVFYDEPSAGLDPIATTQIDERITDMKAKLGMTNVVVTHVMESVQRIADHIVMLDRGTVLLNGTLRDLMDCKTEKVRKFVRGETDVLTGAGGEVPQFVRDLLM